jgi:aristolochene synthase
MEYYLHVYQPKPRSYLSRKLGCKPFFIDLEINPSSMAPIADEYVLACAVSITPGQAKAATPLLQREVHIPSSDWTAEIHPLHEKVIAEVDGYFLQYWPFPNEKARKKFVAAGFSRVTCLYFPRALDDRIHYACRLLTLLFLVDGKLRFS